MTYVGANREITSSWLNFSFLFLLTQCWPRRCRKEELCNILGVRLYLSAQAVVPDYRAGSQLRAEKRGIEPGNQDNGCGTKRCS